MRLSGFFVPCFMFKKTKGKLENQEKIGRITKKYIAFFHSVGYDGSLNGYSLIPSWWRDRPNETQQPANMKMFFINIFRAKVLNLKQG